MQATGQGPIEIFPSARDAFFVKGADISLDFERDTKDNVTGFVLHQHGDQFAARLSPTAASAANHAIVLDSTTLHQYIGKYRLGDAEVFDLSVEGAQAFMALTGQPSFPIFASARDEFFYTGVDAQLSFVRDEKGVVVALILHQNGEDQRAPRIR